MDEPVVDFEQVEAMGISRQAYDEVLDILGHQPSIDELSTRRGRYQILYGSSSLDKDLQTLDFVVK